MPRQDPLFILITRPQPDADRFADAVAAVSGPFDAIISPAFSYDPVGQDAPQFEAAIFTSKTGVARAPAGDGRPAWCVGDATSRAARAAGYDAISAGGDADDLVALILDRRPQGALLHIRGEISRGDVRARLVAAGVQCDDWVAYRKVPLSPSQELRQIIEEKRKAVITLFSAETVSIIAGWSLDFSGQTVVAISETVAAEAAVLMPGDTIVAARPDMAHMAQAVARLIA